MRVLISGGAGFIGAHLARAIADRGDVPVALDTLSPQVHRDPHASLARFPGTVIRGDVADAWVDLPRADVLVHLAAETGTAQSAYERDKYHRANVIGTRNAARWAAEQGIPLVTLSSRAVYGEGLTLGEGFTSDDPDRDFGVNGTLKPSHEDDPHRPLSFYGETKSLGEALLWNISPSIPVSIIRPQNVIGPGQAAHNPYTGVLAAFVARLREGRDLSIYGDGTQTRDFVHVSDLVDLILWSIDNPNGPGDPRVVNSGSGIRTSLDELAAIAVESAPARTARLVHIDVHREGDIEHACADLGRLRALGAPVPTRTVSEAVRGFVRAAWDEPPVPSSRWDEALEELSKARTRDR